MTAPEPDPGEATYEPVLPFLPVVSRGGPYADEAYVAGYEMGQLEAALRLGDALGETRGVAGDLACTIHAANRAQADLLAMHHGYLMDDQEPPAHLNPDGTWLYVRFRRAAGDLSGA